MNKINLNIKDVYFLLLECLEASLMLSPTQNIFHLFSSKMSYYYLSMAYFCYLNLIKINCIKALASYSQYYTMNLNINMIRDTTLHCLRSKIIRTFIA